MIRPLSLSPFALLLALVFGNFLVSDFAGAQEKDPRKVEPPKAEKEAPKGEKDAPKAAPVVDLSEFRTVDKLITTRITRARPAGPVSLPGYLGINVKADGKGVLAITQVQPSSPAEKAGLKPGDVLAKVDDRVVRSPDDLRELLQAKGPGARFPIAVVREEMPMDVTVTLEATSRPMSSGGKGTGAPKRSYLGVQFGVPKDGEGVLISEVTKDSPADKSGLKKDDVVVKMDGKPVQDADQFRDLLTDKKPGDKTVLTVERAGKEQTINVTLGSADTGGGGPKGGGGGGAVEETLSVWQKSDYRLAVVVVDFPDFKRNPKITAESWDEALFSHRIYDKTATGQTAHGSLNDYYLEQSFARFHISGKVFDPISVAKKRGDYYQGAGGGAANKTVLLNEALDKLTTRDGKEALRDFDGLCFIYCGAAVKTDRGSLYYPHRGSVTFQGKRWPYIICPEGGATMESISVFAPEFGKLLGLPDLAARPELAGSEGLGIWCLMSNGAGQKGKPGHLSAWCKEQLGWLQPAVIDPTIKQKVILRPVVNSGRECVKVLVRLDGSEYLLLENRAAKGFDGDLPGQGLLIWRVTNGQPVLEEAHGVTGPTGPRVHLDAVPYPSKANNAFTPLTTPSSRSVAGGGLPVFLTNIRRLPDGRITFFVGYEYY
jgi:M6 family metalloprotease-like protein